MMTGRRNQIDDVRAFARFFTEKVGALETDFLGEALSLPEARFLHEIGTRPGIIGADLARDLDLDAGYSSRLLKALERRGLVQRRRSTVDARRADLVLSSAGQAVFERLQAKSAQRIARMIDQLEPERRRDFVSHLQDARQCFDNPATSSSFLLRSHQPGDCGWIMQRFSRTLIDQLGLTADFEATVGEIVTAFLKAPRLDRQHCWIAERQGRNVGSIMLVEDNATSAKLRLMQVSPEARGCGIGAALVEQCIRFARQQRYRRISLWTYDRLTAARKLYEQAGFHRISADEVHDFGQDLISEIWEMHL